MGGQNGIFWLVLLAFGGPVGCGTNKAISGVLMPPDKQPMMMGNDGREWRLISKEADPILRGAMGASVQVTGTRLGRNLWVKDWKITDGGDGSAPFVGVLRRFGSQWLVDDQNSGVTISLVEESLGSLAEHEGEMVMFSGYVVGAHRINVVRWSLITGHSVD